MPHETKTKEIRRREVVTEDRDACEETNPLFDTPRNNNTLACIQSNDASWSYNYPYAIALPTHSRGWKPSLHTCPVNCVEFPALDHDRLPCLLQPGFDRALLLRGVRTFRAKCDPSYA